MFGALKVIGRIRKAIDRRNKEDMGAPRSLIPLTLTEEEKKYQYDGDQQTFEDVPIDLASTLNMQQP
jgi:hypothetical protein